MLSMRARQPWSPWRVKNVTGSRIGVGSQGSRGRELWSGPQHPPSGSVEESPECVVAHAEKETEVIPFGEYSARSPVDRNLPRHHVGPWTVMEGGGNDRGEGFGK